MAERSAQSSGPWQYLDMQQAGRQPSGMQRIAENHPSAVDPASSQVFSFAAGILGKLAAMTTRVLGAGQCRSTCQAGSTAAQ